MQPHKWQPTQALPSLGFSRQEHWSGLPFPSPMHESEKWKWSRSVVPNPQRPHGLQPSRLLRPRDFPGKSTGVGCHCLLLKWSYFSVLRLEVPMLKIVFYLPDFGDLICSLYSNSYLSTLLLQGHLFTIPLTSLCLIKISSVSLHISYLLYFCFPFSFPFFSLFALLGQ